MVIAAMRSSGYRHAKNSQKGPLAFSREQTDFKSKVVMILSS
jgi:hypothetical protein